MGASSAPVHHRYGAPRFVQLVVVDHWESIGVWPSRVTQSWLTPSKVPSPSRTANTGGLPCVHCLHSDRCSSGFVGSKPTIIGLIFRPLMPPASLIWSTKRWMALVCSPYSASDSISNWPSMLLNEMTGKTTLMLSGRDAPRAGAGLGDGGRGAGGAGRSGQTQSHRAHQDGDGAAAPRAAAPRAPDVPHTRIANPRARRLEQRAGRG